MLKFSNLIIFTVIVTIFIDILAKINIVGANTINNSTYITAFLSYLVLAIVAYISIRSSKYGIIPPSAKNIFTFWLFWNIFNIIRGAFLAGNYWDWKFLMLESVPFTLIMLVFYVGNNIFYTKKVLYFYMRYVFLFGFLLIPLSFATNHELYSRIMVPVSIFIVFIPYLKPKWKVLVLTVAVVSVLIVIGFRTHLLKVIISILLLPIYYFRNVIGNRIIKTAHFILFAVPIVLVLLGITGTYNLFTEISKWDEYSTSTNRGEVSITHDSRTFLYVEVLGSMDNTTEWLMGKSASGKYNSIWFYDTGGAMGGKRYRSEVNILNILLYHGIIGVLLYLVLLFKISHLAIYRSNNLLSKMLGLLIASRWLLAFIEEFTQYDLNFYFFWLILGLVSTEYLRNQNDIQLKQFFRLA